MDKANLNKYIETKILDYKNKYTYNQLLNLAHTGEKTADEIVINDTPYLQHIYVLIDNKPSGSLRIVATLWDISSNSKKSLKERILWFIEKPDVQIDLIINRQDYEDDPRVKISK